MEKQEKTNVMRLLDAAKIEYTPNYYDSTVTDGETIAKLLGQDPFKVFKTLVTQANTNEYLVFAVPVCRSLDLKKAAKAAGVKSVQMIKQAQLLSLTGYIHGGCSPIGMKKKLRTFIDGTAREYGTVFCSAGKVGAQIMINPEKLAQYCQAEFAELAD